MKRNILVFPCGSEIALDIYGSVCYSTHFNLIGANSVDDHGHYVYENYISDVPFVDDENFIPVLKEIIRKNNIDAVYPTMDSVITKVKKYEKELGCLVVASPIETAEICLSKRLTYETLQSVVRTPKVYKNSETDKMEFPVFAKPNVGYSARGTKKLTNSKELETFLEGKDDMLIVEYLPGEEYTVDCFTNRHGELLYGAARQRNRISNGISVNTFFAEDQSPFKHLAEKINSKLKFQGAWFFQVKYDKKGELCLLEIASRLGGSSLLSKAKGVNLSLLSLFDAFGYDVDVISNDYEVALDRALGCNYTTNIQFDAVYCDYDDCLVLNKNRINTELVKFLYKCVNDKKKIFLLSKHDGSDLMNELKAFRISELFDSIIHIGKDESKSTYITESNSIFIDDSHTERLQVKRDRNIPVFGPEMIDVLL